MIFEMLIWGQHPPMVDYKTLRIVVEEKGLYYKIEKID